MPRLTAVTAQIDIAAPPTTVWGLLVNPHGPRRWMDGAEVRSTWSVGAPISIDVRLEGVVRHDRGTVLAAEPERLLRYSYGSEISRHQDTPDARSEITFELLPRGEGTTLRLTHGHLTAAAAGPHARLFWTTALEVLRAEAEGRQARAQIQILDA
jgi:uncharacterized protein YndB with AHSA1/START domain